MKKGFSLLLFFSCFTVKAQQQDTVELTGRCWGKAPIGYGHPKNQLPVFILNSQPRNDLPLFNIGPMNLHGVVLMKPEDAVRDYRKAARGGAKVVAPKKKAAVTIRKLDAEDGSGWPAPICIWMESTWYPTAADGCIFQKLCFKKRIPSASA